jgi:CheY-like chemotaxis protein
MIVDDNPGTRDMMRQFLDFPGIAFCECASGLEAVERANDFKPHWVTMDVNMPGLNGFKATKALRAQLPSARVLIISAINDPLYPQLSREAGAVGFICKENILALRLIIMSELETQKNRDYPPQNHN